jgi:hypothetical protein
MYRKSGLPETGNKWSEVIFKFFEKQIFTKDTKVGFVDMLQNKLNQRWQVGRSKKKTAKTIKVAHFQIFSTLFVVKNRLWP